MNKTRTSAVSTLVLAFSLFASPLVSADNKGSNSPSQTDVNSNFKSAMEKFKQDQKTFSNLAGYLKVSQSPSLEVHWLEYRGLSQPRLRQRFDLNSLVYVNAARYYI